MAVRDRCSMLGTAFVSIVDDRASRRARRFCVYAVAPMKDATVINEATIHAAWWRSNLMAAVPVCQIGIIHRGLMIDVARHFYRAPALRGRRLALPPSACAMSERSRSVIIFGRFVRWEELMSDEVIE